MIQKSYSSERQADVSTVDLGNGFTEVWLRRNHEKDTADDGPEGEAREFWVCDEIGFTVAGHMDVTEATESFDELWSAHERDGMTAEEMAREAVAEAKEAKEMAGSTGTDPQIAALARMQVMTMDLSSVTSTECATFRDYWPKWQPDTEYAYQQPLRWKGLYYRASKALTSSKVYPPDTAGESEYYPVEIAPDGIIVYRECHGQYDMVQAGETRHYPGADGPVYRAKVAAAYSPDVRPQDWEAA